MKLPSKPATKPDTPAGSIIVDPVLSITSDNSPAIMNLQQLLHAKGYHCPITGHWDAMTDIQVREYQRLNGFTPNGMVGPGMWAKLRE